ncbi:tyrosine-type recombinase/integrase [Limnoglobus roseus]|uniref:Site-specific integrase n=1 Tax=Limnoglobus roseus TaxID=2598579 RepID=A0A5C1AU13_9BACT|nr:site-specific integrase [Limnoglobus roseus]QEL21092.1 site-specific integrase [Limnoglobus roseus]
MKPPAYCHHKPTDQAYVTVRDGTKRRVIYLGAFGSAESYRRYGEVIAGVAPSASPPLSPTPPSSPEGISLADAYALWIARCRVYYRLSDGEPSDETENNERSWAPLLALFPEALIVSLTKKNYTAVREEMIRRGWCRKLITQRWGRILRGLKWLAAEEYIPDATVLAATLPRLQPYRSAAPETEPVKPVPLADVRATQKYLRPFVAAMVELQLLTGMRPGEVRKLRLCDLVWEETATGCGGGRRLVALRLGRHKTIHRGKVRLIPLSGSASELLTPYALSSKDADAVLFSPAAAPDTPKRWRNVTLLSRCAYADTIRFAAQRAGVAQWSPGQIRHLVATVTRKNINLDAARALLGHSSPTTTLIYAERDEAIARAAVEALEKALHPPPPPKPTPEAPPGPPPTPPQS